MQKEEIYDLFLGTEPKTKVGLDLVRAALETVNRALKGKAANDSQEGREPVSSANLEAAKESLELTIDELDPSGKTLKEIHEKAAKAEERALVAAFRTTLKQHQ
jgi:hypothetical protein